MGSEPLSLTEKDVEAFIKVNDVYPVFPILPPLEKLTGKVVFRIGALARLSSNRDEGRFWFMRSLNDLYDSSSLLEQVQGDLLAVIWWMVDGARDLESEAAARKVAAEHLRSIMEPIQRLKWRAGAEYAAYLLFWEFAVDILSELPLERLPEPDISDKASDDRTHEEHWIRHHKITILGAKIERLEAKTEELGAKEVSRQRQEEIKRFSRVRFGKYVRSRSLIDSG